MKSTVMTNGNTFLSSMTNSRPTVHGSTVRNTVSSLILWLGRENSMLPLKMYRMMPGKCGLPDFKFPSVKCATFGDDQLLLAYGHKAYS
jgi:hypothetical protein